MRPTVDDVIRRLSKYPEYRELIRKEMKIDKRFCDLWNRAESLKELMAKTGQTYDQVYYQAHRNRVAGADLEYKPAMGACGGKQS